MKSEIQFPVGKHQSECAICGGPLERIHAELTSTYPNLVCWKCNRQAENEHGEKPTFGGEYRAKIKAESDSPEEVNVPSDAGENPVFIDGQKCWRRYRFGGFVTSVDQFDCDTMSEFKDKHYPDE